MTFSSLHTCLRKLLSQLLKWGTSSISSSPSSTALVIWRTLKHSRNVSRVVSDTKISIELHGLVCGTELREKTRLSFMASTGIKLVYILSMIKLHVFLFLCACIVKQYCPLLTLQPNCSSAVQLRQRQVWLNEVAVLFHNSWQA